MAQANDVRDTARAASDPRNVQILAVCRFPNANASYDWRSR